MQSQRHDSKVRLRSIGQLSLWAALQLWCPLQDRRLLTTEPCSWEPPVIAVIWAKTAENPSILCWGLTLKAQREWLEELWAVWEVCLVPLTAGLHNKKKYEWMFLFPPLLVSWSRPDLNNSYIYRGIPLNKCFHMRIYECTDLEGHSCAPQSGFLPKQVLFFRSRFLPCHLWCWSS